MLFFASLHTPICPTMGKRTRAECCMALAPRPRFWHAGSVYVFADSFVELAFALPRLGMCGSRVQATSSLLPRKLRNTVGVTMVFKGSPAASITARNRETTGVRFRHRRWLCCRGVPLPAPRLVRHFLKGQEGGNYPPMCGVCAACFRVTGSCHEAVTPTSVASHGTKGAGRATPPRTPNFRRHLWDSVCKQVHVWAAHPARAPVDTRAVASLGVRDPSGCVPARSLGGELGAQTRRRRGEPLRPNVAGGSSGWRKVWWHGQACVTRDAAALWKPMRLRRKPSHRRRRFSGTVCIYFLATLIGFPNFPGLRRQLNRH